MRDIDQETPRDERYELFVPCLDHQTTRGWQWIKRGDFRSHRCCRFQSRSTKWRPDKTL